MYDLVSEDETIAIQIDSAIRGSAQDGWRSNPFKQRKVRKALEKAVGDDRAGEALELAKHHVEY